MEKLTNDEFFYILTEEKDIVGVKEVVKYLASRKKPLLECFFSEVEEDAKKISKEELDSAEQKRMLDLIKRLYILKRFYSENRIKENIILIPNADVKRGVTMSDIVYARLEKITKGLELDNILSCAMEGYINAIQNGEDFINHIDYFYMYYRQIKEEKNVFIELLEQSKKGWYGKTKGIPYIDDLISQVILILSPTVD